MRDRHKISVYGRLTFFSALLAAAGSGSVMAQRTSPGFLQTAQYTLDITPQQHLGPSAQPPQAGTDPETTDDDMEPKQVTKNPPLHPDTGAGANCSYYNGHTYCPR